MTLWAAAVAEERKLSIPLAPRATSGGTAPVFCALLAQLVAQILAFFGAELARMALRARIFFFTYRGTLLANERTQLIPLGMWLTLDIVAGLRRSTLRPVRGPAPWLRPSASAKPCPNEHPH